MEQATRTLRNIVALLAFLVVAGFTGDVMANAYNACIVIDTAYEDVFFGEDYFSNATGPYPAHYIKARVTRGGVEVMPTTYAASSGCIAFADTTNGQFKIDIWSEVRVPSTDNPAVTNTTQVVNSAGSVLMWSHLVTYAGASGGVTLHLAQGRVTNLLAVGLHAGERGTENLNGALTKIHDDNTGCPTDDSCNGPYNTLGHAADVRILPAHNARKFVIGHELGHAYLAHWFSYNPIPHQNPATQGTMYSRNEGGSSCEFTGAGKHAIHSKEYSSSAFVEGYCHYYATYLFNVINYNTPDFWYYKDETGIDAVNMEIGPTGGIDQFLESCTGSATARGVELDWARQFWDFRTDAGTLPSNAIIARQLKNGLDTSAWDMEDGWQRIQDGMDIYDAAHATSYRARWDSIGAINGIDH